MELCTEVNLSLAKDCYFMSTANICSFVAPLLRSELKMPESPLQLADWLTESADFFAFTSSAWHIGPGCTQLVQINQAASKRHAWHLSYFSHTNSPGPVFQEVPGHLCAPHTTGMSLVSQDKGSNKRSLTGNSHLPTKLKSATSPSHFFLWLCKGFHKMWDSLCTFYCVHKQQPIWKLPERVWQPCKKIFESASNVPAVSIWEVRVEPLANVQEVCFALSSLQRGPPMPKLVSSKSIFSCCEKKNYLKSVVNLAAHTDALQAIIVLLFNVFKNAYLNQSE